MDPLSIAGLGLGIAPLLIEIFSGCVKGYKLYLEIESLPEDQEYLRVRIKIELSRLLQWGEKVGLNDEKKEGNSLYIRLDKQLAMNILLAKQNLFRECMKQGQQISGMEVSTMIDSTTKAIEFGPSSRFLKPKLRELFKKALAPFDHPIAAFGKLKWVMVGRENFEKLVEKLIHFNNSIVSLLDSSSMDELHKMHTKSQLMMVQVNDKVDELVRLANAMRIDPGVETNEYGSPRLQSHDLTNLAKFKAYRSSIEDAGPNMELELVLENLLGIVKTGAKRSRARYLDQEVWIEWKAYQIFDTKEKWHEEVEKRIKRLANILAQDFKPVEFRVPRCLGYVHDRTNHHAAGQLGLLFALPSGSTRTTDVLSLRDLLTRWAPSLTIRISLAHALANTLVYLHAVNWLHKGLQSDNIVFFNDPHKRFDYTSPIISGFEFSRPDLPAEFTEDPSTDLDGDIYRHPMKQFNTNAPRSKKSWDIYSLGVVLVEIAFWLPVSTKLQINTTDLKEVRKVRNHLLKPHFLEELSAAVGEKYTRAVQVCIEGGFQLGLEEGADESDPDVGAELLRVFSEEVVDRLGSISL